jgi:hypothetical protein
MSRTTGLLLINAGGEMFFIDHGILAYRLGEGTTFAAIDPNDPEFRAIADLRLDAELIKQLEGDKRGELGLPERTYPSPQARPGPENLGPMLFQAFNVEIETGEAGESEVTGNGTGIEGG